MESVEASLPDQDVGGEWCSAYVHGNFLLWPTGEITALNSRSATSFSVSLEGALCTAQLGKDGKLHWGNGEVWTRREVPMASRSVFSSIGTIGGATRDIEQSRENAANKRSSGTSARPELSNGALGNSRQTSGEAGNNAEEEVAANDAEDVSISRRRPRINTRGVDLVDPGGREKHASLIGKYQGFLTHPVLDEIVPISLDVKVICGRVCGWLTAIMSKSIRSNGLEQVFSGLRMEASWSGFDNTRWIWTVALQNSSASMFEMRCEREQIVSSGSSEDDVSGSRLVGHARLLPAGVCPEMPVPIAVWDFRNGLDDTVNGLKGHVQGNCIIDEDGLILDGSDSFVYTDPLDCEICEKTLVVSVELFDLGQRDVGVIAIGGMNSPEAKFDSIVYNQRLRNEWLCCSDFFHRTQSLCGGPEHCKGTLHEIIATYARDGSIAVYKDAVPYGSPYRCMQGKAEKYTNGRIVFGARHMWPVADKKGRWQGIGFLKGRIKGAKLYDRVLTQNQITANRNTGVFQLSRIDTLNSSHYSPGGKRMSAANVKRDHVTTLIIRHLPSAFDQEGTAKWLAQNGYASLYDFLLWFPAHKVSGSGLVQEKPRGYAFINFRTAVDAEKFRSQFQNFTCEDPSLHANSTQQPLSVEPAKAQGFASNYIFYDSLFKHKATKCSPFFAGDAIAQLSHEEHQTETGRRDAESSDNIVALTYEFARIVVHKGAMPDDSEGFCLKPEWIDKTEDRGISMPQLRKLLRYAASHCHMWIDSRTKERLNMEVLNLYNVNDWIILPATSPRLHEGGCAFVELVANERQPPKWFVSHWWGEKILDFYKCLEHHAFLRHLSHFDSSWVCAYANRQHSLDEEISDDIHNTSFYQAMQLAVGILLCLDENATALTRIWCAFEEFEALEFNGAYTSFDSIRTDQRKLLDISVCDDGEPITITDGATKDDERDHFATLCKSLREESFPNKVLKRGLSVKLNDAEASMKRDEIRIRNWMKDRGGAEKADTRLHGMFVVATWRKCVSRKEGSEISMVEEFGFPKILEADEGRTVLSLDFSYMFILTDADVAHVASGLPISLQSLALTFEWCGKLTDESLRALAGKIERTNLRCLNLNVRECRNLTCAAFRDFLNHVPNKLTHLTLFLHNHIDDDGCEKLAESLSLKHLDSLNLSFRQCGALGQAAVKALAEAYSDMQLKELSLDFFGCRHVQDEDIKKIVQHLPANLIRLCLDVVECPMIEGDGLVALYGRLRERHESTRRNDVERYARRWSGGLTSPSSRLPQHKAFEIEIKTDHFNAHTFAQLEAWVESRKDNAFQISV